MLFATAAATALVAVGAGPSGPVAAAAGDPGTLDSESPVTVVADGLHSPRNMIWGPDDSLLVSEAGTPDLLCDSADLTKAWCYGLTGSIADISSGEPERIREGLASNVNSMELTGPAGMAYIDDRLYVLEPNAPEIVPSWLPKKMQKALRKQFGTLLDVTDKRKPSAVANPGHVNYQWMVDHPDQVTSPPAANAYAMTPKPGGGFYYVDTASNTLGEIGMDGDVDILEQLPQVENGTDSVPTCIDTGPDKALYIGELTGVGSDGDAAKVYRYDPKTGELKVWKSGFSAITGCGFGANGDFYVTEFDVSGSPSMNQPKGAVVQISKDGTRTTLGEGKLMGPSGFLAGPDGSVYVANNSIWWPYGSTKGWDKGEVVKIG